MATAITPFATFPAHGTAPAQGRRFTQYTETSDPNTALTITTSALGLHKLTKVIIKYSTSVTLDATITFKSRLGTILDAQLEKISYSGTSTAISIPSDEVWTMTGDYISVHAPAGGLGVTVSMLVETEDFGV